MIVNKWFQLTPEELREVVESPKNVGIKGSVITFIIVTANVGPYFVKHPIKFTKAYMQSVLTNFIHR